MDAHLFRRICQDLAPALIGCRIEKIYQVSPDLSLFSLYGLGKLQEYQNSQQIPHDKEIEDHALILSAKKHYLLFKESKQNPMLLISNERLSTGSHAPAKIMRLRKYLSGRRIERGHANWILRQLYLEIQGEVWLKIDLRHGIELIFERPQDIFPPYQKEIENDKEQTEDNQEKRRKEYSIKEEKYTVKEENENYKRKEEKEECRVSRLLPFAQSYSVKPELTDPNFAKFWAEWEDIPHILTDFESKNHLENRENTENIEEVASWELYPTLTPLLRKSLLALSQEEGQCLYADLQFGNGDLFIYEQKEVNQNAQAKIFGTESEQNRQELFAWELPESVAKSSGFNPNQTKVQQYEDTFLALDYITKGLYAQAFAKVQQNSTKPYIAEFKRLQKLKKKLIQEEERLTKMHQRKKEALLLQTHLYNFGAQSKAKEIEVTDFDDKSYTIKLDPAKTIQENMQMLFHSSARGKRGLDHLELRHQSIDKQIDAIKANILQENALQKGIQKLDFSKKEPKRKNPPSSLLGNIGAVNKGKKNAINPQNQAQNTQKSKNEQKKFPSQVQVFHSSDGFTLLRGRDVKGNGLALKMASPHDIWVHVAHGTSAHVIIRKQNPKQEIPEQTLQEAGILAALKSPLKEEHKASIQYSYAKHIRPMKNSSHGMVHVDKSEGSFLVNMDKEIEEKLK